MRGGLLDHASPHPRPAVHRLPTEYTSRRGDSFVAPFHYLESHDHDALSRFRRVPCMICWRGLLIPNRSTRHPFHGLTPQGIRCSGKVRVGRTGVPGWESPAPLERPLPWSTLRPAGKALSVASDPGTLRRARGARPRILLLLHLQEHLDQAVVAYLRRPTGTMSGAERLVWRSTSSTGRRRTIPSRSPTVAERIDCAVVSVRAGQPTRVTSPSHYGACTLVYAA